MSNIRTYRVNHAMQMISIPLHSTTNSYHLGNNRMVMHEYYGAEQMNNYYPYGGLMSNSTGWNAQRFKYNGKEFDRMHGLDWYDYGARWMDPALGRWHSMDPLCEKYYSTSPYAYCRNNPIMRIDVDGLYDVDTLNNYSPVVAIFPANYKEDVDYVKDPKTGKITKVPGALQYDHMAAVKAGVNVVTVISASDALDALTYLNDMGIQYNTVTINSHGNANCFYIGEERVTKKNADKAGETLAPVLKGKDVFIGACNVGKNMEMLQSFSVLSESTTIGAQQQVNCAYKYDGSNRLNMPLPWSYKDDYSVATPIGGCTNVKNVTINKYQGISWNNKGW